MEKDELLECAKIERKEHPWLTLEQAKRIASDHIAKDPEYYEEEEEKNESEKED